jgi:hypothetical protein
MECILKKLATDKQKVPFSCVPSWKECPAPGRAAAPQHSLKEVWRSEVLGVLMAMPRKQVQGTPIQTTLRERIEVIFERVDRSIQSNQFFANVPGNVRIHLICDVVDDGIKLTIFGGAVPTGSSNGDKITSLVFSA